MSCAIRDISGDQPRSAEKNLAWISAVIVLLALTACTTVAPPLAPVPPIVAPETAWARVLDRFVEEDGAVDFAGLARDREDLNTFVEWISRDGPASRPELFPTPAARLAYWINAYNAISMYGILEQGIPDSLAGFRKIDFFVLTKFRIDGESRSLRSFENDVIRKEGEERVHFALNCMSRSCPRLPKEPFLAARLEEQLSREARLFFGETRNVELLADRKVVRFSEILKWYEADFLAKSPSVIAYANRWRETPIPEDFAVEHVPYDWRVNQASATTLGIQRGRIP